MTDITEGKIACMECGHKEHILKDHLIKRHEMTIADYVKKHPGSEIWSPTGGQMIRKYSESIGLKMQPRDRKLVAIQDLFPDFAARMGAAQLDGKFNVFRVPGDRTPTRRKHYVFPIRETLDMLAILEKPERNRIYAAGPSGSGKSDLWRNLAAVVGADLYEWNANSQQTLAHLVGQWTAVDGNTVWVDGVLVRAMEEGAWLVIHEIDTLSPDIMNVLKPVLEDPPTLMIQENGARQVRVHPDFRIGATANTWARGDSTGLYVNTYAQSAADARRWTARIKVTYPSRETEIAILKDMFDSLEKDEPDCYVNCANDIRDAYMAGKIDTTFSTGELISWVDLAETLGCGPHHASRLAFSNAYTPDVQTAVEMIIATHFGAEQGQITPKKEKKTA